MRVQADDLRQRVQADDLRQRVQADDLKPRVQADDLCVCRLMTWAWPGFECAPRPPSVGAGSGTGAGERTLAWGHSVHVQADDQPCRVGQRRERSVRRSLVHLDVRHAQNEARVGRRWYVPVATPACCHWGHWGHWGLGVGWLGLVGLLGPGWLRRS